jgi:hypothetical protein
MRTVRPAAIFVVLINALAIIGPPAASAQDAGAGTGLAGGPGDNAVTESADGIEITGITVRTTGTTGDPARDAVVAEAARDAIRLAPGERWNSLLGSLVLAPVRALPHVESASATIASSMGEEATVLVVTVRLKAMDGPTESPAGLLATGRARDLPTLYRNGDAYVRLLLDGGVGVFSDGEPWFGQPKTFTTGNPLVQDPAKGANTGSRSTWTEGYVQFGIGGVVPLVGGSIYAYGAATGMAPYALGQDIFRNDARATVDLEKLYGGLLYAPQDSDVRVNASVGRQNFTLNDGFLISQYASQWNVGTRPAVYLAPRTAPRHVRAVDGPGRSVGVDQLLSRSQRIRGRQHGYPRPRDQPPLQFRRAHRGGRDAIRCAGVRLPLLPGRPRARDAGGTAGDRRPRPLGRPGRPARCLARGRGSASMAR